MCVVWVGRGAGTSVEVSIEVERWFRSTILKRYLLELLSNMVGGDVGMLVLFFLFWFRLVNKVGIVIVPDLKKSS